MRARKAMPFFTVAVIKEVGIGQHGKRTAKLSRDCRKPFGPLFEESSPVVLMAVRGV